MNPFVITAVVLIIWLGLIFGISRLIDRRIRQAREECERRERERHMECLREGKLFIAQPSGRY